MTRQSKEALSIEIKVTDRCNQECFHCVNRDGLKSGLDLDWKLFNRKLEEWAEDREGSVYALKEIRLTGGEPLVNFDSVLGIAGCCQRLGISSGINTNGLLLDSKRIQLLKDSGVGVIKVSFDAINTATYCRMRGSVSSLRPFFRILGMLVKNRFKVILRFTICRINHDQLSPCYHMAKDLGVYKFQIKPLVRAGRAVDLDSFLSKEEVDDALFRLSDAFADEKIPTEILCWPPVEGTGFSYKICGSIDKIYITSAFIALICNYISETRQVPLGDLSRLPLEAILRRRHNDNWAENIHGRCLLKGCPNSGYFAAPGSQ